MARPKMEINEERCKRLNQVFIETGIPQNWFSKLEHGEYGYISQQAISQMVNKKANVTETTARTVHRYFPQYSVDWLMGYTDYKNDADKFNAVISEMQTESDLLLRGLTAFAKLCDYEIRLTSPAHNPEETYAPVEKWMKMIHDGYTIRKDDQTVQLSLEEMNAFENEVCDFVELKLKHLFKQKGDRNNG